MKIKTHNYEIKRYTKPIEHYKGTKKSTVPIIFRNEYYNYALLIVGYVVLFIIAYNIINLILY